MKRPCTVILVIFSAVAFGQTFRPDAPEPRHEAAYVQHHFFDLLNDSTIVAAAVPIIGDSLSTQHFMETGKIEEANPIARPFVNSSGGQAFISTVGFASTVGAMYLFHRLEGRAAERHPKTRLIYSILERSVPAVVSGVEFGRWRHNDALIQRCTTPGATCR